MTEENIFSFEDCQRLNRLFSVYDDGLIVPRQLGKDEAFSGTDLKVLNKIFLIWRDGTISPGGITTYMSGGQPRAKLEIERYQDQSGDTPER